MKVIEQMSRSLQGTACLSALVVTMLATGCGQKSASDDLAVAKMSNEQIQATGYLPLNDDIPGTPVPLQRYLPVGKYTTVVFYSPYDGESAYILQSLAQLTKVRPDIAVRTINVNRPEVQGAVDWQSPVFQGSPVQKLPYIQIYDPRQSLRAQARPAYEQVMQWIRPIGSRM